MRIEKYFLMTDYSLWEVILNGDSPIPTRVIDGVVQPVAPTTAEQILARKNELKARGTLLMRFGGNKETKKVQKALLKQQYENFTSLSSESLDQIHDRLQKLIKWITHTLIWRNKTNMEDQSLDDLFNSLKIYEAEVKSSSSTRPTTQNITFVSSQNTDSTNESISVVTNVFAASTKVLVSALPNVDTLNADDLEEMDLKWQMAMLTMRARRFLQMIRRNLEANGTTSIRFDMSKVKCYNCHMRGHFARECSLEYVKARLVVYQHNENVFEKVIKLLKLDVMLRDNALVELRKKFEKAEIERDELKLKLEIFQTSIKNLSKLLASQITDKTRLGYDNQVFTSTVFDCDELISSESDVSMPPSPVYDRYQSGEGYHDVPPPYSGTFMPHKPDLVFHDAPTVNEIVPTAFNVEPSTTKPNKDLSQSTRPSAPIIEDWVSDSEDESEGEPMPAQNAPSFIQTSKHIKTPRPYVKPGNPQHALKDKRVIDSGCSRHMTENISYLSNFGEINRGYVTFGKNPKGGKITGKGNQPNSSAGIQEHFDAGKAGEGNVQQYVLFPLWSTGSKDPQNTDSDATFEVKEPESEVHVSPSNSAKIKKHDDKTKREAKGKSHAELSTGVRNLSKDFEDFSSNNTNEVNAASTPVPAVEPNSTNSTNTFSVIGPSYNVVSSNFDLGGKSLYVDPSQYPDDPDMPALEDITYSDDEEDEEGIDYEEDFAPVARIEAIRLFLAYASFMGFMVYQMDVKSAFLYETIEEEVYVYQPLGIEDPDYPDKVYKVVKALYGLHQAPRAWYETLANYLLENGFYRGKIDQTLFIKRQKGDILLVQVYVDDIIFGSANKDLCKAFEKLMKDKFQISSMSELTFFLGLQVKQKEDGIFISQDKYVAEILRKFGLTDGKSASIPIDIEKLLLKDPDGEDVDVHTYSDYTGASLDRKSTTGGCQFLCCRLISWQCKKQTVVATSSTEAEYIAAASCCAQVYGFKIKIFAELARMGYEKPSTKLTFYKAFFSAQWNLVRNVDNPSKFYMYLRFQQLMINAQIADLSSYNTKYTSPALTQKVFANMRRVGKGFFRVYTSLFEGMLVPQQVHDDIDGATKDVAEPTSPSPTPATTPPQQELIYSPPHVAPTPPPSPHQSPIAQPSLPPPQQPPSHDAKISMTLINQLLETCATLTKKVGDLEQDKIAQAIEITKLKQRFRRLEKMRKLKASRRMHPNRGKIAELDANEDVTLEEVADEVTKDDDAEPAELKEIIKVVTTAKLMTEVVTAAAATTPATTIIAAPMPKASAPRRRKGVIIHDPEETATLSVIVHYEPKSKDKGKGILFEEPKPLKRQAQIEQDEAYARELEAELNANINWNKVIEQFKRKEKQDNAVMRYQALKRKPVTEAQERKNMMIYLKNMVGFKMDFFKGTRRRGKQSKSKSESSKQKAAKKQRIDEEVKELKTHLQIVPNDEDDVYTESTPLALKVHVVGYQIHTEHNKPYYKIIRADGTHQLFLSFISLLRNFDKEDLEMLWKIFQQRFASSELKNFSDDFLLNALKTMFENPNVEANIWKNQRGRYGLSKVKS
nr:putative ribonuclease H-like domain-containing protein [Tanacetum cinerariifolium]